MLRIDIERSGAEISSQSDDGEKDLRDPIRSNSKFTETGLSRGEIKALIADYRRDDLPWDNPRNLKASYNAGAEVSEVGWEAFSAYQGDNLLYGQMMFPSLLRMADEITGKALEMLHAGDNAVGTVTSGGTESIILAVKAARDRARSRGNAAEQAEMLVPSTAHPAFNKAGEMLGVTVRRVPVDDQFRAVPARMEEAVRPSTIMIVGSAPAYPVGSVDPIEKLGKIALEHDLWLHVDGCVGGFFLPFAADLGLPITPFDFAVAGVRSMSADLHKYGYANRGASLLLLADSNDFDFQQFVFRDWPTGQFVTATIAGSRPGGAIASSWAVMNYLGYAGYRDRVEMIIAARDQLISRINDLDGVCVLGRPEAGILGIGAEDGSDMAEIRAGMSARGWVFGPLAEPVGMNLLLNKTHGAIVDTFVSDLKNAIADSAAGLTAAPDKTLSYGS